MKNLAVSLLKGFGLSALCLSALFFFLAQSDAPQSQLSSTQTRLSSAVWTAFDNYERLTGEALQSSQTTIDSLKNNLLSSQERGLILERHLGDTTASFLSLSEESRSLRNSVANWMEKYYKALIPLIILSALCVLNWIGKGIMFILWIKKVPVPRWLDILI